MRVTLWTLTIILMVCISTIAFSGPPAVSNNVIVLKNTTANMCPSNWEGKGGGGTTDAVSGYGQSNGAASIGVKSCSGCVFDPQAKTCTCATCYDYFD